MAVEFQEKRQFPRYPCDTGVLIHVEKGRGGFWGTLSDICIGGCYVYTFSPLPVGQGIELVIKANGKEITVSGKTVSSHPGVGMGISFTKFSNGESEATLRAYVDQLASQPASKQASGVFH